MLMEVIINMKNKLDDVHVTFMKTLVREASFFFYNLHVFCENYEKKIGKTEKHIKNKSEK